MATIKFSSQGNWTVTDLHVFFHSLNVLYNRLYVIDELKHGNKARLSSILDNSLSRVPDEKQLSVDHIKIHSPALFSLTGLDKIIGQLRDLIKDIGYRNSLEKQERKQAMQHQDAINRVEVADQEADLLAKQVGIMKNNNFTTREIQDNVRKLINPAQKISSVMQKREVCLLEENGENENT